MDFIFKRQQTTIYDFLIQGPNFLKNGYFLFFSTKSLSVKQIEAIESNKYMFNELFAIKRFIIRIY